MNLYIQNWILRVIAKFDSKDSKWKRRFIKNQFGIEIGRYTYGYNLNEISAGTQIGCFCSFASGVKIGRMNHPTNYVSTHPFLYYSNRGFIKEDKTIPQKERVIIEDDVWIGNNAMILPGVKIGRGAVIGAGAVVTRDVPSYAVYGGVPARHIKWRFEKDIRDKLVKIDWPSWDDKQLEKSIPYFYDPEIFLEMYEKGKL